MKLKLQFLTNLDADPIKKLISILRNIKIFRNNNFRTLYEFLKRTAYSKFLQLTVRKMYKTLVQKLLFFNVEQYF